MNALSKFFSLKFEVKSLDDVSFDLSRSGNEKKASLF
jgi:hypothetical protein